MAKLLLLFTISLGFPVFSQSDEPSACSYCTNMEDALVEPERVSYLNLSAQGHSVFPEEINQLINLKTLDLSQNTIDRVDFSLLELKQLKELNLSNNPGFDALSLEGMASTMPNLEKLDLSQCAILYVSKELSNLKRLEALDVSNNAIQFIPSSINQLSYLDVSGNQLSDVFFLTDSWRMSYLDVSNNPKLKASDIGGAIRFKEDLKELILSPDEEGKRSLPSELADIGIKKLVIKGGKLNDPNFQITKNDSIESLVFEEVEITNPKRFVAWVNRMEKLEEVEFRNMEAPRLLNEMTELDRIKFSDAVIEDKMELREIKPSIQIMATRTDIRTEGYIGNSKISNSDNLATKETRCDYAISESMRANKVEPFVRAQPKIVSVSGSRDARVTMDFSSFDIPSEAFLTQSGELYTGDVRVEVKEYMDPTLNALSGTPMTYRTGEEDIVFSSSGMFDFRAYDDAGNELKPNPENPIDVEINDLMPAENSDLYFYNDSIANWEVLPNPPVQDGWMDRKRELMDSLNEISDKSITNFYVLPIATLFEFQKSRKDPYTVHFRTLGTKKRVKRTKEYNQMMRTANPDQRWVARQYWKIDTIVDEELLSQLSSMKFQQRKVRKHWYRGVFRRPSNTAPRFIKDLKITPDLARDNYRLEFIFKGELVSLPVLHSYNGSLRKVQYKEKRNFARYQKNVKLAKKDQKNIDKYEATVVKRQAETMREREATYLLNAPKQAPINSELLRFGLNGLPPSAGNRVLKGTARILSFGLINCDRPIQLPMNEFRMDAIALDQNGEEVNVPPFVRAIYPQSGGYMSVSSAEVKRPKIGKSYVIFQINESELAIVRDWKKLSSGAERATLERLTITDLSPGEIREKIMEK